jgi:hypothetical protein
MKIGDVCVRDAEVTKSGELTGGWIKAHNILYSSPKSVTIISSRRTERGQEACTGDMRSSCNIQLTVRSQSERHKHRQDNIRMDFKRNRV